MAYYDYDFEGNTLSVFKGKRKKNGKIRVVKEENENFEVLEIDGRFAGIRLHDAYDRNERSGKIGEDSFKKLLESKSIPSMFIGQNPLGVEFNSTQSESFKRADFIINPPGKGSILVDVKARSYLGADSYPCKIKDLQDLVELEREVRIPVWLAYTYSVELQKDYSEVSWHFANASILLRFAKDYNSFMQEHYPDRPCTYIRLPHTLFVTLKDQLYFEAPLTFEEGLVKKTVTAFIKECDRIKEELLPRCKEMRKKNEVRKLVSSYSNSNQCRSWLYQGEMIEILCLALGL